MEEAPLTMEKIDTPRTIAHHLYSTCHPQTHPQTDRPSPVPIRHLPPVQRVWEVYARRRHNHLDYPSPNTVVWDRIIGRSLVWDTARGCSLAGCKPNPWCERRWSTLQFRPDATRPLALLALEISPAGSKVSEECRGPVVLEGLT